MRTVFNYFYYIKDITSDFATPNVKIDSVSLDPSEDHLVIAYRLGRQRLLQRSNIKEFEIDHYNRLSVYDKQRLTKFLTLQGVLSLLKEGNGPAEHKFIKHLQEEIKHDKLL